MDRAYRGRAVATTLATALTSAYRVAKRWTYGGRIARAAIQPPIVVLGHWRSGITHLHNLLALDERFAAPRYSQVLIPDTFLTGEHLFCQTAERLLRRLPSRAIPQWGHRMP